MRKMCFGAGEGSLRTMMCRNLRYTKEDGSLHMKEEALLQMQEDGSLVMKETGILI